MTLQSIAQKNFPSFDIDTSLSQMLGTLHKKSLPTGIVLKNNRYMGLIDRRSLFGTHLDPTSTKVDKCTKKTPQLTEKDDLNSALETMSKVGLNYLPLKSEDSIVGIVRAIDLVIEKLKVLGDDLTVHNISFSRPTTLYPTDRIGKALKIMQQERIDQVPVFKERNLLGVVSDATILKYLLMPSKSSSSSKSFKKVGKSKAASVDSQPLGSLLITPFMTSSAIQTITRESSLKSVLMLMLRHSLSDVVVMENDRVYGLLTLRSIVSYISSLDAQEDIIVNFVGISKTQIESAELDNLKKIAYKEAEKLQRRIQQDEILVTVRIKELHKKGNKHQYSVATRVEAGGRPISSSHEDWKIETALRKSFNGLGGYKKK